MTDEYKEEYEGLEEPDTEYIAIDSHRDNTLSFPPTFISIEAGEIVLVGGEEQMWSSCSDHDIVDICIPPLDVIDKQRLKTQIENIELQNKVKELEYKIANIQRKKDV